MAILFVALFISALMLTHVATKRAKLMKDMLEDLQKKLHDR